MFVNKTPYIYFNFFIFANMPLAIASDSENTVRFLIHHIILLLLLFKKISVFSNYSSRTRLCCFQGCDSAIRHLHPSQSDPPGRRAPPTPNTASTMLLTISPVFISGNLSFSTPSPFPPTPQPGRETLGPPSVWVGRGHLLLHFCVRG